MTAPDPAFWRGDPVASRRVRVRIPQTVSPSFWCAAFAGQERDALRLETPEGPVLIDDEDGVGRAAVSSAYHFGGFKRLPVDSEILDTTSEGSNND